MTLDFDVVTSLSSKPPDDAHQSRGERQLADGGGGILRGYFPEASGFSPVCDVDIREDYPAIGTGRVYLVFMHLRRPYLVPTLRKKQQHPKAKCGVCREYSFHDVKSELLSPNEEIVTQNQR